MPPFGRMPLSGGVGRDLRRQIQAILGLLLLLPLLRWLEGGDASSSIAFPNKLVAAGSSSSLDLSTSDALLAGRGGVGESGPGAVRCVSSSLLAGHGGEEEQRKGSLILACGEGSCLLCWCGGCPSSSFPLLALVCRGGKLRSDGHTDWMLPHRNMPAGCYGASSSELLRAEHASLLVDGAILGRKGGPTTTSMTEAFSASFAGAQRLSTDKWFRPRRRRDGWRMLSNAGSVLLGISVPYLDGDVCRSPASGGGDILGSDCFSYSSSRVFFVTFEVLSSNPRFLSASDVKGPRCNLYPPRMQ
jgi:hypothetical protein